LTDQLGTDQLGTEQLGPPSAVPYGGSHPIYAFRNPCQHRSGIRVRIASRPTFPIRAFPMPSVSNQPRTRSHAAHKQSGWSHTALSPPRSSEAEVEVEARTSGNSHTPSPAWPAPMATLPLAYPAGTSGPSARSRTECFRPDCAQTPSHPDIPADRPCTAPPSPRTGSPAHPASLSPARRIPLSPPRSACPASLSRNQPHHVAHATGSKARPARG
jgi:hypothetical protein